MTLGMALCAAWFGPSAWACSPAGHSFVAIASLGKLRQAQDPEVRKLGEILYKYRSVMYWGAEGPDMIQRGRKYQFSHWFPLYTVNYEHPERFDLEAAQPYVTALLKGAYDVSYRLRDTDITEDSQLLFTEPRESWRDVSLAFACGYVTHLLSDYFCHAPAKVWWDRSPELQTAVLEVAKSKSYGIIQEFYAVMLWERYLTKYGVAEDAASTFPQDLALYHVDNGVLPYCGLASSKASYAHWPEKVLASVDPSKYDVSSAPMRRPGGAGLGGCVAHERKRVLAMVAHMGLSLDEAIELSQKLTDWQGTYGRVIDMIVNVWTRAAPNLKLQPPDDTDVVRTEAVTPSTVPGMVLALAPEAGAALRLVRHRDAAVRTYHTRDGEEGPVTEWGKKPSGARFDLGVVGDGKTKRLGIITDGPWLTKSKGYVKGVFNVKLPKTASLIRFESAVRMHGKSQRSDGVTFRLLITGADGMSTTCFEQHVNTREPVPISVDMGSYMDQQISISLVSDAGPKDHCSWDWGAWLDPTIAVRTPPLPE
jgi:hypothetical protein